ncbi:hypothetical protein B9Z55_017075 [Caenorhabditis nigoni]|uniref:Zinc finger CCCH domain-containing protein 14 n=1 Tax=Caenorhabditis nigoni TaxID=1611254 RepID=A0A2G5T7U9_9PELO|nr:hypothetical protein B9Z55_017075 [Caenorhabditis nigoni]
MSSQPGTGTSEVSKKLKAAIRAKLEELGVYVDDELPDYIMVMIANKKEKVQMKDDLNLFIGKSTAKFVDWLFDLFDRLQNASNKQGESSSSAKKDEEKKKEQEAKEQEEKRRKEKEERERELQKEKEREKERQRERDREKRLEEEKRREEKRKEASKPKRRRTRSRSNTYSDDERVQKSHHREHRRPRSTERRRGNALDSGEETSPRKLQSKVTVNRKIPPTGDTNVRGRGTMFLRAMNEASVSAGYGGGRRSSEARDDDDMSDVEALPSKSSTSLKSPKKSLRDRLSRVTDKGVAEPIEDDAVVLGNQPQTGGPQMILKLSGGREAIKRTRIQDRIVINDDSVRRGLLKRRVEMPGSGASEEPKSKHERIKFDVSRETTPSDDSPTMQKWNGHIRIGDDSEDDDEEAEIDALVAEARGIVVRRDSAMEEEEEILPSTHQLSGASFIIPDPYQSAVPAYIPTPLSVLNEQQNQMGGPRDHQTRERCVFWPKCTKKEACPFAHPTTNCKNFPNCTYGNRCLFIHPQCRFDRFCTKKHCPFTHPGTGGYQPGSGAAPEVQNPLTSNRVPVAVEEAPQKPLVRGALGNLAEKLAASIKKKPVIPVVPVDKKEEKSDENQASSPIKEEEKVIDNNEVPKEDSPSEASARVVPDYRAPLQNMIHCRYAGGCRNPVCHFKHPKECRFGANCRNSGCYFYHKPSAPASTAPVATASSTDGAAAKYKWSASAAN